MKRGTLVRITTVAIAAWVTAIALPSAPLLMAQTAGQKTFASSKEAIDALVHAVKQNDSSLLQAILGEGSKPIVSSGDEVADEAARENFLTKYNAKHSLVSSGDHQFTLNVGTDGWPLPIPLVDKAGKWYFDGAAGKEEILYRRIGHNEIDSINVCKGVVAAQRDYAASTHDGNPVGTYAQRIISSPGKQDGLYWEVKGGEPQSPAGSMLAEASQEGYDVSGKRTPYHGYYYSMLKNPGGFAFLAYSAEYRSSGVMTFVVTQNGVIHEKDLGENTSNIAQHIDQYKIDNSWKVVK